jgi:hypothetical protein
VLGFGEGFWGSVIISTYQLLEKSATIVFGSSSSVISKIIYKHQSIDIGSNETSGK